VDARRLDGQVALVTGAAGGIGQAVVRAALAAGARIAAFDKAATVATVFASADAVLALRGDARREEEVRHAVESCIARLGRLDLLVNAAGRAGGGCVEEQALDEWRDVLEANLTSAFLFCKHAIPHLKRARGAIVTLSSTNGLTGGSPLSGPAYAVAKAGLIALTKNLAREPAADGVRANAVAPGPIDTPMLTRFDAAQKEALRRSIPLGVLGTPEDVAELVVFLAAPAARYLPGVTVSLSGGLVMP